MISLINKAAPRAVMMLKNYSKYNFSLLKLNQGKIHSDIIVKMLFLSIYLVG